VREADIEAQDGGGGGGGGTLKAGDKVEADFKGRGRYYPGTIGRDRGDGSYDIDYDDGEREMRVPEKSIRALGGKLREGDKIEARYRGKSKYYPGRISRDRGDGSYDIDYDDGEKETRVSEELIRSMESGGGGRDSSPSRRSRLEEGMKVKANYRGKGKMFGGTIKRDNGDGTYDIGYDDGDREMGVREADIEAQDGGGGGGGGTLKAGDKVEADFKGRGRYYPGTIGRDRGDGSYDIDYDDGEREMRVPEKSIRALGGKLREGDKIEARYRGKSKYYPGRISRDRGDGSYDIDYDDGEKETRVSEELIRSMESGGGGRDSSPSRRSRLEEGMKVKANYRGKGKMFGGTIKRDNGDGTYDINYDDGDREQGVREADIEADDGGGRGGGGGGGGGFGLREGSKVEARYRGKTRYYPGKISRDHRNGTYDIDYDDGEKETRVSEDLIKAV